MASITVPGIGSGLDVNNIVEQLVEVERVPSETRFDRKEAELQAQLSGYGSLKGALSQFRDVTSRLTSPTAFDAHSVAVSDPELFTATASSIATPGDYRVEVRQLAQSHSLATQAFENLTDVVGNGTLTIQFGTTDYDPGTDFASGDDSYDDFTQNEDRPALTVTVDNSNNTLEGIRDTLNDADAGINASIVNDGDGFRLLLVAEDTGAANSLRIAVADEDDSGDGQGNLDGDGLSRLAFNADATNLEQTQAGLDAELNVNGLTVSRDSNMVAGVVPGVTLTLLTSEPGKPAQLSVSRDTEQVRSAINDFVNGFNDFRDTVRSMTAFDVETGTGGVLMGDSAVRSASRQITRTLSESLASFSGDIRTLVDLGITTQSDGSLAIDEDRLEAALDEHPETVARLFAGELSEASDAADADDTTATEGIADRLTALLTGMLDGDGLLETKTEGLQTRINSIEEQRAELASRIAELEERLRAEFSSLDLLLSQLRTTGDFLTAQLDTLPTIGRSRD